MFIRWPIKAIGIGGAGSQSSDVDMPAMKSPMPYRIQWDDLKRLRIIMLVKQQQLRTCCMCCNDRKVHAIGIGHCTQRMSNSWFDWIDAPCHLLPALPSAQRPYLLLIIAQAQRCSMVNVGNNGSHRPVVPYRPHTGNKHQCSSERQRLEWISSRTNSSSLGSRSYSFANSSSCESNSCCQTSRSTDISS